MINKCIAHLIWEFKNKRYNKNLEHINKAMGDINLIIREYQV